MQSRNKLATALVLALCSASAYAQTLGFIDDQVVRNDLQGTLPGMVKFAQTHTIDPNGNDAAEQPMLVAQREALLMFIPAAPIPAEAWTRLRVEVLGRNGLPLGILVMAPPQLFPHSDRPVRDARPDVLYSTKAFTARLPWNWVQPGMGLRFRYDDKVGNLRSPAIEFSGASELTLQNIRIGMLTEARPASDSFFESNPAEAALDYFQKVPIARLTVAQYLPVTLDRIVLPNGTIYTDASADTGGVHNGDMREAIGKALISHGINFANFGIVDSVVHSPYPNQYRQVVVHQSVGLYANGIVRHGLSGGAGMATLDYTTGNEFSHELGHNYGLGHYPGGGRTSTHNDATAWGYDAFRNRMHATLNWTKPAGDTVVEGYTTPSFKGLYSFNTDPMAGASVDSAISKFTLHMGYTMKRVQQWFAASAVIDPSSPSGYSRWDAATRSMVPDTTKQKPVASGIPVMTLVGFYDPLGTLPTTIYPALYGNYGNTYALPVGTGNGCRLDVSFGGSAVRSFALTATRYAPDQMNKFHVNLPMTPQPQEAAVYCKIDGQSRELNRMAIDPPSGPLSPVMRVGKEDGFLSAALRLPVIADVVGPKPFASHHDLEAWLADEYGEVNEATARRSGRVGSLYRFENKHSGRREYFLLKVPHYADFPANGTSNHHWRYIGHAGTHVDWSPEPFAATRTAGTTLEQKLMAYYHVAQIKQWRATPDPQARAGDLYVRNNPTTRKVEYWRLDVPTMWSFAGNGLTRREWSRIGDRDSLSAVFSRSNEAAFSQQMSHWYRQDALRNWDDNNQRGNVGDIYRFAHSGRVEYFQLRTPSYWYYPINGNNNAYWTYLGTY